MDAFERSAEDELGCLGSDSDGEASHDAEAPAPRLAIGNGPTKRRRWWCASVAGRGRAWAKWPGATGCRLIR